jgi:cysteinyl-tRNA synthetase
LLRESKKNLDYIYGGQKLLEEFVVEQVDLDPTFNRAYAISDSYDDLDTMQLLGILLGNSRTIQSEHSFYLSANEAYADPEDEYSRETFRDGMKDIKAQNKEISNLLGLLQKDPEDWFKGNASSDDQAEFDAIALRRQEARAAKDWDAADAARDEATAKGIVLEDGPDGTTWRKA